MSVKSHKKELSIIINEMKKRPLSLIKIKKMLKDNYHKDFNFNSKYYQGKNLIHYSIEYGLNRLIKTCIKYGCNPNICDDNYFTPLHFAVAKSNVKAVKILLKNGVDANIPGEFEQTPLHLAVICGNLPIIKLLIKYNADIMLVDEKNLSVLDYAKDEKNNKIIDYLEKNLNYRKEKKNVNKTQ